MAISTLYDYYTSLGQALPSLSTRSGLYSQYGLTGNYTGTAEQNTALLQKLMSGSTTPTTTVAPILTTTVSNTPVAADTLSAPTTQIRLPASNFDTGGAADSTVAGAVTTQKSLQDYINQLTAAKTPEQTQADALSSSISDLLGQNTGRSTTLGVEEANRGVPGISKDLADINAQIATRTAAYDKQYNAITNPTDPNKMAILPVAGSQAEALRRQEASDIGFLQARALGLQGQLSAAQDAAKRAVDLRYGAIEEQINNKLKQLEVLQPTLTKQEKLQAAALQLKYEDEKQALADKKEQQKTNVTLAINSGITTRYANHNGQFFDTVTGIAFNSPQEFFRAAGVTTFEDAYAKKLVSDISAGADFSKYPASYQEYILAKRGGYTGSYNDYQNMDANRRRSISTTNNVTYGQKIEDQQIAAFDKAVADYVVQLGANKISWATAFNALKAQFPQASNELIDQRLNKDKYYTVIGQ